MLTPLIFATLAFAQDGLQNGNFESKITREDPLPGWVTLVGATNGANRPESVLEIDTQVHHGGRASLHFKGKTETRAWLIARQAIPVRPGGKYTLEGWTRASGVTREGIQFHNCYMMMIFEDAGGNSVSRQFVTPELPDSDWSEQSITLVAPENARAGRVMLFLSMTGDFWVDDLTLDIEGGAELPDFEEVWREDFAEAQRPSREWKKEVGATNGTGGKVMQVEIDAQQGVPDSPRSLRLSGDDQTRTWFTLQRAFPAEMGELFRFSGQARAEDVRQEGVQFENFHVHVFFLDRRGEQLGTTQFVHPGKGSYDWTPFQVEAIAPKDAKFVRAGAFLSMSGAVWLDDLLLEKQPGNEPPYSDFVEIDKQGLVLHYSKNDPEAKNAAAYLQALVERKAEICRVLDVKWREPIHIYVYADDDTGRALTGRSLDFADPSGRKVHQRWNSHISHEITHVIAHNSLNNSQTGILGEGIAVWLDSRSAARHHGLAAELLRKKELPSIADLLADFGAQPDSYPASGSFCGWLLAEHGLEVFKEIYPLAEPSARAKELVGKSLVEMEADWHAELAKY